jgi:peptide/nickel transport system permease protein
MTLLDGPDAADTALIAPQIASHGRSTGVVRATLSQTRGKVGAALVGVILVIAIVGPFVKPYSATDSLVAPFSPPTKAYLLGTDVVGRDVVSRLLDGGYVILLLALAATAAAVLAGAVLGCFAAQARRAVDEMVMRPLDVLMSFPLLVLGLLFLSVFGDKLWLIALTVFLGHLPHVARTTRAAALGVRDKDFVQYATSLGTPRARIVFAELLPNVVGVVLVEFGLRLGYSIGVVAALGFIGFGPPPPAPDWGGMISENLEGVVTQPWPVVAPVLCIATLTIGVNFLTDALAKSLGGLVRTPGQAPA